MGKILYIVIPCYNEEEVLEETTKRLTNKLDKLVKSKKISKDSRILYVNDGSKDKTWEIIVSFYERNKYVVGLNLSRNYGHQNALLSGLRYAKEHSDIVISMDADLQDDIEVVDKFIEENEKGSDIVYGVRNSRKKDSFFKRTTASLFYKLMRLIGVEIIYNHADYRLMSKRSLDELENFREVNLFLRGIIPMLGYKTSIVKYDRDKRFAGESKYPLRKMLSFALNGVLSFSIKPIRFITSTGFLLSIVSFLYLIYCVVSYLVKGVPIQGWTTIVVLITLFGSFQIFCIGVIGEYIGRIYIETKQRPRFIIERTLEK